MTNSCLSLSKSNKHIFYYMQREHVCLKDTFVYIR